MYWSSCGHSPADCLGESHNLYYRLANEKYAVCDSENKKQTEDKWNKFGPTKLDKPEAVKIEEQQSILLMTHTLKES